MVGSYFFYFSFPEGGDITKLPMGTFDVDNVTQNNGIS